MDKYKKSVVKLADLVSEGGKLSLPAKPADVPCNRDNVLTRDRWYCQYDVLRVHGKRSKFLTAYRHWLDHSDPYHHLYLITQKDGQQFLRLHIVRKHLRINYQKQFVWSESMAMEAYAQAVNCRQSIPDEIFCMVKRSNPEVPGVYLYPGLGYKGDISTGSKRTYRCFSFAKYKPSEAYSRAVKCVFDAKGIPYPKQFFKGVEEMSS